MRSVVDVIASLAPSRPSALAHAKPIPFGLPHPVTIATRPSTSFSMEPPLGQIRDADGFEEELRTARHPAALRYRVDGAYRSWEDREGGRHGSHGAREARRRRHRVLGSTRRRRVR